MARGHLGLGHWYSAFGLARGLREYPKAELVAAAWDNERQLEAFTRTFGVKGYRDYGELLERERIDIVHLAAPVAQLADLTIRSAQAGKHIILGKPMAMNVAEADRDDRRGRSGRRVVPGVPGHQPVAMRRHQGADRRGGHRRHRPAASRRRWSIAEDWYRSGTPGWFADPRQVPGGAFIDEGIYWIDLFRWLASSEVVRVDARMANLVHKDIEVEDWGMATFTFASGLVATLEASWTINAPRKTGPSPKQNSVVRLEVVGTRGEIIDQWFRAPGRAVLAAGASDWVFERQSEEPFAPASPFPLTHLVDCLEQRRPPVATIQDARRSLVVALAAYESAREGRPVHLSW